MFQIELRFYLLWRFVLRYEIYRYRWSSSMKKQIEPRCFFESLPHQHGIHGALVKTSRVLMGHGGAITIVR